MRIAFHVQSSLERDYERGEESNWSSSIVYAVVWRFLICKLKCGSDFGKRCPDRIATRRNTPQPNLRAATQCTALCFTAINIPCRTTTHLRYSLRQCEKRVAERLGQHLQGTWIRLLHGILPLLAKVVVAEWGTCLEIARLQWIPRVPIYLANGSAASYPLMRVSKQYKLRHWAWKSPFDWRTLKKQQYRSASSLSKRTPPRPWVWECRGRRAIDHHKYTICSETFVKCWVFKGFYFAPWHWIQHVCSRWPKKMPPISRTDSSAGGKTVHLLQRDWRPLLGRSRPSTTRYRTFHWLTRWVSQRIYAVGRRHRLQKIMKYLYFRWPARLILHRFSAPDTVINDWSIIWKGSRPYTGGTDRGNRKYVEITLCRVILLTVSRQRSASFDQPPPSKRNR